MKSLTVAIIGSKFMGRAHSNAYRQVNRYFSLPRTVRMKTICGRDPVSLERARIELGWEDCATDWRTILDDPEIDVVDIAAPGNLHAEIAIAAARAGKAVWCEKPLANTLSEAQLMADAVAQAGVHNGIFHNYRKLPAVQLAKDMIVSGQLGEIRHYRGVYLQDWLTDPSAPFSWRVARETAGAGALADLGSHAVDLARHLVGEIIRVNGVTKTFVTERPSEQGSMAVDVPDAAMMLAEFANGCAGTIEVSRCALGRKNHNRFEINGTKGSVVFDLERLNEIQICRGGGIETVQVTGDYPYADAYWPTGHGMGYEHSFINWVADAVRSYDAGTPMNPDFADGLQTQRVLQAVEDSAASGNWQTI